MKNPYPHPYNMDKEGLIVSRSKKDTKYSVFVDQEGEKIGDIFFSYVFPPSFINFCCFQPLNKQ